MLLLSRRKVVSRFCRSSLYAHLMGLSASRHDTSAQAALHQISKKMARVCREMNAELAVADIEHLLYAIQCNAHRIVTEDAHLVAVGLFPFTSMLNHSCEPNCAHDFVLRRNKPPVLVMRAIVDIEVDEELCYSYTKLYQSTRQRNDQLQAAYGFKCDCPRCVTNTDNILESSYPSASTKELMTCLSLANKDAATRPRITKRMIQILSDSSKVGEFHPLHQVLFQTYTAVALAAYASYLIEKDEAYLHAGLGYGLLSVSCSYSITHRILLENLHVVCAASRCLHLLAIANPSVDEDLSNLGERAESSLERIGYHFLGAESVRSALKCFENTVSNSIEYIPGDKHSFNDYAIRELERFQSNAEYSYKQIDHLKALVI